MSAIHRGCRPATEVEGAVSSIFEGSTSTASSSTEPESDSDSYSTIAECTTTTTTTLQSIPSYSTSGGDSCKSGPRPRPITRYLAHRDPLAAFHVHKALKGGVDGGSLRLDEHCKWVGMRVGRREEENSKEEGEDLETEREEGNGDELGVLWISGSDDSGSDSGSTSGDSDTDLESQVSEGGLNYSPSSSSTGGNEELDHDHPKPESMIFQRTKPDYLLDYERRKYRSQKHARTQRHSMTCPSAKALGFTSYAYSTDEPGSSDGSADHYNPQETPSKDRQIFMRAWRKSQERMSKGSGRLWNLVDRDEKAIYGADDDF